MCSINFPIRIASVSLQYLNIGFCSRAQQDKYDTGSYQDPTQAYIDPTQSYQDPTQSYQDPTQSYQDPTQSYQDPYRIKTGSCTKILQDPGRVPTESWQYPIRILSRSYKILKRKFA